jgi:carotenoid cleavage dioxygenase-like enzyme
VQLGVADHACGEGAVGEVADTETQPNPYLVGNFGPVRDERDDPGLSVTGAILSDLDGLLLRNGPNPILDPDPAAYHWFLGDGMLHGIELSEGRARYRNLWVRTRAACEALGLAQAQVHPAFSGPQAVLATAAARSDFGDLVEVRAGGGHHAAGSGTASASVSSSRARGTTLVP